MVLKQGETKWFKSADELMEHYKQLKERTRPQPKVRIKLAAPKIKELPPPPPPKPILVPVLPNVEEPWPEGHEPTLQEFLQAVKEKKLFPLKSNITRLAAIMEKTYGLDRGSILGSIRRSEIARHRHELYYYLVKVFDLKLAEAGRSISRDHTTILHGVRKYERYLASKSNS